MIQNLLHLVHTHPLFTNVIISMTEHFSECLEKLLDLSMAFGVKRPLSLQNVLRVQHNILQIYGFYKVFHT